MLITHSALSSTPLSDLPPPRPLEPITIDNVKNQIGLVQNFFLAKLHANNDQPLVEDDDLPQKQRLPKPRLPPTGKITSPRKRPQKEQGPGKGHPRKKMKLIDGEAKDTSKDGEGQKASESEKAGAKDKDKEDEGTPLGKPIPNGIVNHAGAGDPDSLGTPTAKGKQKENEGGMISPESIGTS